MGVYPASGCHIGWNDHSNMYGDEVSMNKQTVYVVHDDDGLIKGLSLNNQAPAIEESIKTTGSFPFGLAQIQCQHKKCYTDFDWCETLQDVRAEASTPGSVEDMVWRMSCDT